MNIGRTIKELRQKNNITQSQLADILNVSPSSITMYENGRRLPDITTIIHIAKYFNVSVDYLIGNSDIPNTNILAESDIFKLINNLSQEKIEILRSFINILTNDESTTR